MINKAKNDHVCTWDGYGYNAFKVSSGELLGKSKEYDKDTCLAVINGIKGNFACVWEDGWVPYHHNKKSTLGRSGYRFREFKECLQSYSAKGDIACNWSGKGYQNYSANDPQTPFSPEVFKSVEYCRDFTKEINSELKKEYTQDELLTPFKVSNSDVGYTLTPCHGPGRYDYHLIKRGPDNKILPECIPDTLYSWGDYGKAKWFKDRYEKSGDWSASLERDFFLARSPLATFGYGMVALRIKLKKNLNVVVSNHDEHRYKCSDFSAEKKKNLLIINQWNVGGNTGLDHILCSMGPVESWSMGQKEHYDEVLRELNWIQNHDFKEYELYYKSAGKDLLWDTSLDSNDFSWDQFLLNMLNFRQLIDNNMGKIVYQKGKEKSSDHFKTDFPIYYNPE